MAIVLLFVFLIILLIPILINGNKNNIKKSPTITNSKENDLNQIYSMQDFNKQTVNSNEGGKGSSKEAGDKLTNQGIIL